MLRKVKYVALADITRKTLWFCKVLRDYDIFKLEKIFIYDDNMNAIAITKNQAYYGCTKHWDMKHQFIKQWIEK